MKTSLLRIYAVILRSFYNDKRNPMHLAEVFYYPAINIVLWGLTIKWISHNTLSNNILAVSSSIVLWITINRIVYEISVGMAEEMSNRNMTNLFGTPLKLVEWIIALMICGIVKINIILPYCALITFFAYGINIFSFGKGLLLYIGLLVFCCWSIGLIGASIVLHFGKQAKSAPFMIAWLFAPLCAVYYPLESLPTAIRAIASATPLAHVFEAIRHQILVGTTSWHHIYMGIILAIAWLAASLCLFYRMFHRARQRGLASFE